ncbi:response regulator [Paenibacillus psychroresistens]|uniref:Response regulator n=1 Tax=Paenibacillus psychroresistens TaxID=1778678 RepID=A0A6B8RRB9_9BACL|nr:response regulator [Paenibacillus psychroresistens]QGQ98095.1 response regulator [Paenibacillus psychroresistens]
MYKVLLVDDEMLARVGIKLIIPWEEYGFEIIAEAENGQKAIEAYQQVKPDLILTDIKMPVSDGIDLIKRLKGEGEIFKFVVLSSYEDFSYVKEMLRLGAEDYILKLELNPDAIIEILKVIKQKLDQEKKEVEERIGSEKQIYSNRSVMKEKFLKDLILGWMYDDREIAEKLKFLNLKLSPKHLMCIILNIDNLEVYNKYKGNDVYLLNFSVVNIVEEILHNFTWGYIFCMNSNEFVIIYSSQSTISRLEEQEKILQLTDRIKGTLIKFLGTSVTIGISNPHAHFNNLNKCYIEAQKAIKSSFNSRHGSTIFYHELTEAQYLKNLASEDLSIKIQEELRSLQDAIDNLDAIKVNLFFDGMDRITQGSQIPKEMIKGVCLTLIIVLKPSFPDLWENDPYEQIDQFSLKLQFITWLQNLRKALMHYLSADVIETRLIRRAKQYIRDHYRDVVSLEIVAEQLTITANYLSVLFKKQTGKNFIYYVSHVRIEKAKELLKSNQLKNSEIARLIGYENEFYFSRVFKKITGSTPQDFKNNAKY